MEVKNKRNDLRMPVLSGRIISPSNSDNTTLVAVYNGEIVSWLRKLHSFSVMR